MRTVDPAKHAAKRQSILDAAIGCFAEKGFERTTTADICKAAGISSGSLFHYFPTKRAVFAAIFEEDARITAQQLQDATQEDPWTALLHIVDAQTELITFPGVVRLVLEAAAQAARDDEFADLIRRNERALRDGLTEIVSKGIEQGRIDPGVPAEDAGSWVAALIDALISRSSVDPDLDLAQEQRTLRVILTRFLRPIPPPEDA